MSKNEKVLAWHFLAGNGQLRDGRPAPADGEWLKHSGRVAMCESGLHASRRALDALQYAPGALACRVEVRGVVGEQSDKLVATERKILWRVDATTLLREFARRCALDAVEAHWKDAPETVLRFLGTGDPEIRAAAWDAAQAAAWAAAWAAQNANLEAWLLALGAA